MANHPETYVALLRGINVSGKNKIPMAELRSICSELECEDVRTYIQTGNVVFASSMSARALEKRLERAIDEKLDLTIPVIVRKASAWAQYVKNNPFPDEAEKEANWTVLCLSKEVPKATATSELERRATQGERIRKKGDAIWIHYANGIGRSKLTPAVLDRSVGSSVTARNWRTVLKLEAMVRDSTAS